MLTRDEARRMASTSTRAELLERLRANPRFHPAGSPGGGVVIVGAKGFSDKPGGLTAARVAPDGPRHCCAGLSSLNPD